ncbi:MAG: hypothetical protein C3L26_10220 [Candidatus Sedimenticola endophacoides]|nr:MAG: hypothetical protein C3L26_10220 [Candidatus Sedimenticola endophacoides]
MASRFWGLGCPKIFHEVATLLQFLASRGEGLYEGTFRMLTKGGGWAWITSRGKVLFDETGRPVRFVGFNTDVTRMIQQREELREQKNILQYQASHDALTGLANRSLFMDRMERSIAMARRNGFMVALLFIDLDHFKEINDSLGHRTGDLVLNEVTQRLQGVIRAEDTLSRLGGDEFTIIMEGLKRGQDASLLAEKIIRTILNPLTVEGNELYVGSSIGISIYPDNGSSARELLRNADAAMYKAKHEGRNNFQYYSQEMTEQAFERLHMEGGLRTAMKNREFIIHYQPQIKGRDNQVMGVEALVRWQNPSLGLVPPLKFIPIAESTGLIIELDRHVMKQAMSQIARWHRKGLFKGRVAINMSMRHLHRNEGSSPD